MAPICGIPAETIREVARAFATAKAAMILWGMGISQHVHGTDNARCLIALATVAGQIGKPGTGLHPLRGQNNVQGASDAGLIPMMFPNYQRVTNAAAHASWFEKFWGTPLDAKPGYTVVEIMDKALAPDSDPHKVRGMYIMGENPAMSDPDLNHAREALASLRAPGGAGHLHDRDRLAGRRGAARQRLAREDRHRHQHRPHGADGPPGAGSAGRRPPDLWIIQQIARRLGLPGTTRAPGARRRRGVRGDAPGHARVIAGITWERLQREGQRHLPLPQRRRPRAAHVFTTAFPTADGRVKLVPADIIPANERPDADYPIRADHRPPAGALAHRQHDAARRVLDAIEPSAPPVCTATTWPRWAWRPATWSRCVRGAARCRCRFRRDDGTPPGTVFIPFAYVRGGGQPADQRGARPGGKIPEFKYCAVVTGV
jgi:formate dehydrogenase major subunit